MPRPVRVQFAGAVYHVMARGNERREIFRDDKDRRRFLETLGDAVERFGVLVHAYCLMPNHYHLVVETPRANLSQAMAWLQTTYTVGFNRRHRRSGHLFQGRYKSHLVEADAYAQELVRYLHLNPVRPRSRQARISAERIRELNRYRWSSHREYAGWRRKPVWLSLQWQQYWGRSVSEARSQYQRWMGVAFEKPVRSPWEDLRGGLVLGGQRLWEQAKSVVAATPRLEETRWLRQHGRERVQERAKKKAETETDSRLQAWIRIRLGGEQMTVVARDMGYRDGSGVAHVVRRLEAVAEHDAQLRKRMTVLRQEVSASCL
jgi:REP element-mobilizing transposase RayT